MPRAARQVIEGIPHHVVLRGNNRRRLFSYPRDYLFFVGLMDRHLVSTGVNAHALCLMPNHVHLLMTPFDAGALSSFVQRVAQRYSQVRNKRFAATGKLFEQRFYSKPIASESHLAVATAYIDLNPVRAHLVDEGGRYAWSTYRVHCGLGSPTRGLVNLWTPSGWYLSLGKDPNARAAAYRTWIAHCRDRETWDEIRRDPPAPHGPGPTRPDRSRAAS
ncbi:MAG: transposase [Polyangiales bacterium]